MASDRPGGYNTPMYPVLFEIPLGGGKTLPVHSYGFMIVLGFLLGIWIARKEFRRRGLPDVVYDMGLVMLLCGLVGGRIFYYVEFYSEKYAQESFLEIFKIWKGGLVFYGGALGGLLGGWLFVWKKRLPAADCLDAIAMGIPAGMAFGRIGCFLNGCCFGGVCKADSPLAVVFPADSPVQVHQLATGVIESRASEALAVFPVQLFQATHDFMLLGLLVWYLRRPDSLRGGGMPLLFLLYGIGRFCIEFLRDDNLPTFTGLTISQNVAALSVLSFGGLFVYLLVVSRARFTQSAEISRKPC